MSNNIPLPDAPHGFDDHPLITLYKQAKARQPDAQHRSNEILFYAAMEFAFAEPSDQMMPQVLRTFSSTLAVTLHYRNEIAPDVFDSAKSLKKSLLMHALLISSDRLSDNVQWSNSASFTSEPDDVTWDVFLLGVLRNCWSCILLGEQSMTDDCLAKLKSTRSLQDKWEKPYLFSSDDEGARRLAALTLICLYHLIHGSELLMHLRFNLVPQSAQEDISLQMRTAFIRSTIAIERADVSESLLPRALGMAANSLIKKISS